MILTEKKKMESNDTFNMKTMKDRWHGDFILYSSDLILHNS